MTTVCSNCGALVSDEYARVLAVDGKVRACPYCPDRVPDAGSPGGYRDVSLEGHTGTDLEDVAPPEATP